MCSQVQERQLAAEASACFGRQAHRTTTSSGELTVFGLLVLVSVLRALFAVVVWSRNGPAGFLSPDSLSYIELSRSLWHGTFGANGHPELLRTPGYPLLLMPSVAFSRFWIPALVENIALAALSAWLIWKITGLFTSRTTARLLAVGIYCIEPVGFLYSMKILSDTLFVTQLLLFVWLFLRYTKYVNYKNLALASISLGLATYTRPVSIYLAIILIPFLLYFPRDLRLSKRVVAACLFPFFFVLTLAPWVGRNSIAVGYASFSSSSDYNLYFNAATALKAKLANKSFSEYREEAGANDPEKYLAAHPEQRSWTRAQILRFQRTEANDVIFRHPATYALIHAKGCLIVLLDPAAIDTLKLVRLYPQTGGLLSRTVDQGIFRAASWFLRTYPRALLVLVLQGGVLMIVYVLGIAGLKHFPLHASVFFVATVLYFLIVSGFPADGVRYRLPIMPVLCILAGNAASSCLEQRARKGADPTHS